VVDAPPGTACTAVAAVRGADRALLVTEPTPFGLHDLDLAAQMCRALGVPAAAVVNRADVGAEDSTAAMYSLLRREGIPVVAEVPFSEAVARACADGELAARHDPALREALGRVVRHITEEQP
jgi:MinD superfamily P-loop ATPase